MSRYFFLTIYSILTYLYKICFGTKASVLLQKFGSLRWLPDRGKYPNFSIELIIGLNKAKTGKVNEISLKSVLGYGILYSMIEFETEISDIIQRTSNVKSFRFRIKEDIDFKPGQFFFVTIKVEGEEKAKHFSFSNSPTEKGYIEFTKRISGSPFSHALDRLKIGDWARLKMPYGIFTFEGEYEKVAFLSGGIGITPIRSICKFITDLRLPTDMVLLYGNNKEKDIIFRQDLDQMSSANKNLRIVYILASLDIDQQKWPGRTGYIDDKMIREEIADYKKRFFYLCGPPGMVESLTNILNRLDVQESQIKREKFAGY